MSDISKYYSHSRQEMTEFLPDQYSKVLEVGCGIGNFRSNLNETCEVWGIEPNHQAANLALERLDKVCVGKYATVASKIPDHSFDLVICNDVIEHMEDYNFFFQSISEKMTDSGCLVGSIPNVRYFRNLFELLFEANWQYKDEGILDRTHLRFFTMKSLRQSLIENSFYIEKFSGINSDKSKSRSRTIFTRYAKLIFFNLCTAITFGAYDDIQYLQFAFRVKKYQS